MEQHNDSKHYNGNNTLNNNNKLSTNLEETFDHVSESYNQYLILNDEIYENNMEDENHSKMSQFVANLAHSVYADMEYIIETYGNDVGASITPIIVKLLEKLDVNCKHADHMKRNNEALFSELKQLRRYIQREKSFRLEAETSLYQLEEDNSEHKKQAGQLQTHIRDLQKQLNESNEELERYKRIKPMKYREQKTTDVSTPENNYYHMIEQIYNRYSTSKSFSASDDKELADLSAGANLLMDNKDPNCTNKLTEDVDPNFSPNPDNNSTTIQPPLSNSEIVAYLSHLQSQNETIYRNFNQCLKEKKSYESLLKNISHEMNIIKSIYNNTIESNNHRVNYIKSLQQQLTNSHVQIEEMIHHSTKDETKIQKLHEEIDFWKHQTNKYKTQIMDLSDLIEWQEKLNSCNNTNPAGLIESRPQLKKSKTILKMLTKMFTFNSKNLLSVGSRNNSHELYKNSHTYLSAKNSLDEDYLDSIPKKTHGSESTFVQMEKLASMPPFLDINTGLCKKTTTIKSKEFTQILDCLSKPLVTKKLCEEIKNHIWCSVLVTITTPDSQETRSSLWLSITKNRYSTIKLLDCSDFNNTIIEFDINKNEVICMCTVDKYDEAANYPSSLSQSGATMSTTSPSTSTSISTSTTTTAANSKLSKDISVEIKEKHLCPVVKTELDNLNYPTVWVGTESGLLQIYSTLNIKSNPICVLNLNSSIICIIHHKGRVLVSLVNGYFIIFERLSTSFHWNFSSCRLLKFNANQLYIRTACVIPQTDKIWCGCKNKILIFDMESSSFDNQIVAHEDEIYHVRNISCSEQNNMAAILFRNSSHMYVFDTTTLVKIMSVNFQNWFNAHFNMFNLNIRLTSVMMSDSYVYIGTNRGHTVKFPLDILINNSLEQSDDIHHYIQLYSYCNSGSVKFISSLHFKQLHSNLLIVGGDGLSKVFEEDYQTNYYYLQEKCLLSHLIVWED